MLDTAPLAESESNLVPTLGHGLIASRLQRALGDYAEERGLGYVFSAQTTFRVGAEPKDPDLAYVSKDRLAGLPADLDVDADFAPDLAVEIASHIDTLATISRKVRAYLDAGVRAVWVVNPWLRTVEVFQGDGHRALLSEGDALRGDPVVPGFSVDLARIFLVGAYRASSEGIGRMRIGRTDTPRLRLVAHHIEGCGP